MDRTKPPWWRRLAAIGAVIAALMAIATTPAYATRGGYSTQLTDILPGPDVDLECIMEPMPCLIEGAFEAMREATENILEEISSQALDAKVLQEMGLSFDSENEQFINSYAQGFGIALVVMIIMIIWSLLRAARDPEHMEEVKKSLFQYLPMALLLCGVGPAIGGILAGAADALALEFAEEVVLTGIVNFENLTGLGTQILAIILMLALIIAAILVLIVLAVQTWAMYLSGAVMAIAFMMMIDPSLRQKAMKLPSLWIGIVFAKPLLFFLLSMVVAVLADKANVAENFLVTGAFMLVGLLMVVFAPMKLMKHAPILPNDDASSVGASTAKAVAGKAQKMATSAGGKVGGVAKQGAGQAMQSAGGVMKSAGGALQSASGGLKGAGGALMKGASMKGNAAALLAAPFTGGASVAAAGAAFAAKCATKAGSEVVKTGVKVAGQAAETGSQPAGGANSTPTPTPSPAAGGERQLQAGHQRLGSGGPRPAWKPASPSGLSGDSKK